MEFSLVDRLAAGGVGRVNVGLKSNSRRLRRPDGGEEIDGEFVVAGGDPWKCSSGGYGAEFLIYARRPDPSKAVAIGYHSCFRNS